MRFTAPTWLKHRRLSLRVLLAVLALSAILTVIITAYLLMAEYRRDLDALTVQLHQTESSFAESLGSSLWTLDESQLRLQLQGILQLPHVRQVRLQGDLDIALGQPTTYPRQRRHSIPIRYRSEDGHVHALGELVIIADLAAIDARTRERVIRILGSQAAKTFAVSLLLLAAFYYLITRHLQTLAAHARQLRLANLLEPVRLHRRQRGWLRPDELDELQAALNHAMMRMSEEMHQRSQAEQQLAFRARFDPLTELPNRTLAYEHLVENIHLAEPGEAVAAVFLDLDNFQDVNDSYGHDLGDKVLVEAAHRLRHACEPNWIPTRFSGDQFLIIIPRAPAREPLGKAIQSLLDRFSGPVNIAGTTLFMAGSAGVAVYPDTGQTAQELIQMADTALSLAKRQQRGTHAFYTHQLQEETRARLTVASELRQALEAEQFAVHFQPIVDIRTDRVVKLEALVRWPHPERGLISPGEFIPLAEDTGMIVPLGRWVLGESLRRLAGLRQLPGYQDLAMAVNISAQQLPARGFTADVRELLARHGLPGHALELELTERGLIQDRPEIRQALAELQRMGVEIAIDDFGTGYSALNYLRRLPVGLLKIDREFVRDIGTDENDAHLVRAIISLAHALEIRVVAEGVETEEQLQFLRRNDCDHAQGYLIARPMPPDRITDFLAKRRHPHG